jgi:hypothetical protein
MWAVSLLLFATGRVSAILIHCDPDAILAAITTTTGGPTKRRHWDRHSPGSWDVSDGDTDDNPAGRTAIDQELVLGSR